ncbi:MAG: minor capsid protein [Cellulosilyticum sp.]|nr:minor capsid protein [Cellulosilyticum sp.]
MFAKSMVDFLESQGFGERDTNIFINNFPSRTNISNAICVYDTQSFSVKGRARNSVNFTCQIRVRNLKSEKAEEVANNIYKELEKGFIYDNFQVITDRSTCHTTVSRWPETYGRPSRSGP